MKSLFGIKSLLVLSSFVIFSSSTFAGFITLRASTTTPKVWEAVDVWVELPSDYKGIVDYSIAYYNGTTWRNLQISKLTGVSDFYQGSFFSESEKGQKKYTNFVSFPEAQRYRLYAEDKDGAKTSLDFSVQLWTVATDISSTSDTSLTANASSLQADLDAKKNVLLEALDTTLKAVQKLYDSKVNLLVETSMFKAVECLWFLTAGAMDVDVATIKKENETAILEKYVEISSAIKRYSVGLTNDTRVIENAISDFSKTFSTKISTIATNYESTYTKLKSDFEMYYDQNQKLVYELAEKIQKIDTIREQYVSLLDAQEELFRQLDIKTTVRTSLQMPKKSAYSLLKGDLDDLIGRFQSSNPEVSYEKMIDRRDVLLADFDREAEIFVNEIFKSDFDYALYLTTIKKVEDFLKQYSSETSYQCGVIISSSINWERVYLDLINNLQSLTKGIQSSTAKVKNWNTEQVKVIESSMLTLFKNYYTKTLETKKNSFRNYIMQLISEVYYAENQQQEEAPKEIPQVSWTPYTYTKTYNKGTYALELTYLQQFLKAQGLYNGEINGLYNALTIEAVYKYQLQEGVVTWKEANKSAYGWMGPATRAAVNEKMNP